MQSYIKHITPSVWLHNKLTGSGENPCWKVLQSDDAYTVLYDESGNTRLYMDANRGFCKITEESSRIHIDITCSQDSPEFVGSVLELILTHKNIRKFNSIVITDNSSIECISHYDELSYEIRLMDMYFVCTGCTWYSSLAPMFMLKERDEKQYIQDRQRILSSLSWNDFLERLSDDVRQTLQSEIQFEDENRKYEPAYKILNSIRNGKYHCIFFNMFIYEFLRAFNVESMFGKEWCIPLKNGRIVSNKEDTLLTSCKHSDKQLIPDTFIEDVSLPEWNVIKESIQIHDIPKEYTLTKDTVRY